MSMKPRKKSRRQNARVPARSNFKDAPSGNSVVKKSKRFRIATENLKVRRVRTKLRVPRDVRRSVDSEDWLRFQIVMPLVCAPLWNEIQEHLRELGVTHENKAIENGMHVEILMAEFWASTRIPKPEGWKETVD